MIDVGPVERAPGGSAGAVAGAGLQRADDPERERLRSYLPRVLLERLVETPDAAVASEDATLVFVDISGFTRLSERLARSGREGAEHLVEVIDACFTNLLAHAYADGGSLLKFGGDALLLWFAGEEHARRACRAAATMRGALRRIGRIPAGASSVVLRMSVGVHSGVYDTYLVGGSHREYIVAGPTASTVVALEAHATSGQILLSHDTAARLPARCLGASTGSGLLLARVPDAQPWPPGDPTASPLPDETVANCLSTALRAHLMAGAAHPEHRTATVSFVQFGELDALVETRGAAAAAVAIEEVVRAGQEAADRYDVCMLGSDIAADGGKLLFSAGAPRAIGDDEERMLRAMRHVVEAETQLPVRAGVNRGYVFAGEVGPPRRRTYAVMGDTVNLAARLCAKAPWRAVYATEPLLERARGRFDSVAVPPFTVKGKVRPVVAFEVGGARRATLSPLPAERLPLIGRDRELERVRRALAAANCGRGLFVELSGVSGSGTSRLLTAARELADGVRAVRAICDSHTRLVPYIVWRELLRQLLDLRWDAPDALVLARLRAQITSSQPELECWLPLLAIASGAQAPATREVDELAADAREAKLHEVVLRFLAPALALPTIVQIEQLDLMDEASAALLSALVDELPRTSWLVIGTRREEDTGFVAASGSVERLRLGPLSRDAALALADATPYAHQLPPHTIALAVDRAAGNPEFLLALLGATASGSRELPDTIESAASATIDSLEPGDRALVRRAAVLGELFRAARLAEVLEPGTQAPDETTLERLSGILERQGDGYLRFASPVLCEVAYTGLPFGVRRALHAAIGEALERDLDSDVDADPAVLSEHFSSAGDHDRAWRYALMGAERASARFAVADAVRLYRRAIDAHRGALTTPREIAAVWEALGEALMALGETVDAERALTAARRLFADDPIAEARICFRRGQIAEREELSNAVRWMRRGLRLLEPEPGPDSQRWHARLIADLAWIRQRQRRYREAEALCREALAVGEAAGELRAQARASYTLDWALFELGRYEEATHSARALEIYRELGDPEQEGRVLNNLGGLAYWRGRWQEAIELYEQAGICSERAGHAADRAFTDGNIGEILSDQGHLEAAAERLRRAQRVWSATGDRQGCAFANMLLGRVAVRAGRTEEGLALLHSAVADMERFRVDFYTDLARALIADGEALAGDPRRGLALAEAHLAAGSSCVSLLRRASGAALTRLGETARAEDELRLALAAARERDEDYEIALTLDALAAIAAASRAELLERATILERLGVVAVPVPAPTSATSARGADVGQFMRGSPTAAGMSATSLMS
jgi:class 3 adenylate cyclase/tetratricopeptide (TPR) repeat protein